MQDLRRLASAVGVAILLAAHPVRAAVVANCGDLDLDIAECTDFSSDDLLEFDLALLALADVALQIETAAGERTADSLVLRAYLYNDSYLTSTVAFDRIELRLDGGARFVPVGTVRDFDYEPVPVTRPDDVTALIEPSAPLPPTGLLEIGELDPDEPGAKDWEIDLSALSGTGFTLRVVSVPEPGAPASAAFGLLALAALAQRSSRCPGRSAPPGDRAFLLRTRTMATRDPCC